MMLPYSAHVEPTYENIRAECPECRARNVFNRASDLQSFEPIDFKIVRCQNCFGQFKINGDWSNVAYQALLFDCCELIERKEYRQCILLAAQSYEVFFDHFLQVQLACRPFASDPARNLEELNHLLTRLYNSTSKMAFERMRSLVLQMIVSTTAPRTLAEARASIDGLRRLSCQPCPEVDAVADSRLRKLLAELKASQVNRLRNRIVHKNAYRPTHDQALIVHTEARHILHGIAGRLGLGFDLQWYMRKDGGR